MRLHCATQACSSELAGVQRRKASFIAAKEVAGKADSNSNQTSMLCCISNHTKALMNNSRN